MTHSRCARRPYISIVQRATPRQSDAAGLETVRIAQFREKAAEPTSPVLSIAMAVITCRVLCF